MQMLVLDVDEGGLGGVEEEGQLGDGRLDLLTLGSVGHDLLLATHSAS